MEVEFQELDEYVKNEDHDKVLEKTAEILKAAPADIEAYMCKLSALLALEKYKEVIEAVDEWKKVEGKASNAPDFVFYKAYAFYVQRKEDEALECLDAPDTQKTADCFVLRGQIFYRKERFAEAVEAFNEAIKLDKNLAQNVPLQANLVAAQLEAEQVEAAQKTVSSWSSRYGVPKCLDDSDCQFNAACALAAAGDYTGAKSAITKSLELAEANFDEDTAEEDKNRETAPIRVQSAYISQCSGERAAAASSLLEAFPSLPRNTQAICVAANNLASLRQDHDTCNESYKRIKEFATDRANKLSPKQKEVLEANKCLLLMRMGKYTAVEEELALLIPLCGAENERAVIYTALSLFFGGKQEEGLNTLKQYVSAHKECVYATLVLAQLLIQHNDHAGAIAAIENATIGDITSRAGMLSCLAVLKERTGDVAGSTALLKRCAELCKSNPMIPKKIARRFADKGMVADANEVYNMCEDKKGAHVDPVRVLAAGQTSITEAEALCKGLPYVPGLPRGVTVTELENLPAPKQVQQHAPVAAATAAAATANASEETKTEVTEKKRKRPKKKRVPKNMDPNAEPDPERWLPKSQRSSAKRFKGRGSEKRRRAAAAKAANLSVGLPGMQDAALETELGKAMTQEQIQAQQKEAAIAALAARSSGRAARGRRRH